MTQEKEQHRKEYLKEYKKEYNKNHTDIRISVSNKDYKAFQLVAKKRGQSVTSFFRDAAFAQARHVYLYPKEIKDQSDQLARDIHGVSTNINQLTRYVHEDNTFLGEALRILQERQKEIKGKLFQFLELLNIKSAG